MGIDVTIIIPMAKDLEYLIMPTIIRLQRENAFYTFLFDSLKYVSPLKKEFITNYFDEEVKEWRHGEYNKYGILIGFHYAEIIAKIFTRYQHKYNINAAAGLLINHLDPDHPILIYYE